MPEVWGGPLSRKCPDGELSDGLRGGTHGSGVLLLVVLGGVPIVGCLGVSGMVAGDVVAGMLQQREAQAKFGVWVVEPSWRMNLGLAPSCCCGVLPPAWLLSPSEPKAEGAHSGKPRGSVPVWAAEGGRSSEGEFRWLRVAQGVEWEGNGGPLLVPQ